MKKLLVSIIALLGIFGATANETVKIKASGVVVSEVRNVKGFTKVSTSAAIDVYLTQGDKFRVEVKADKNVISYVKTAVDNGRLVVGYKESISFNRNTKIATTQVFVTMPEIEALSASSAGDINLQSNMQADNLKLNASSSGDVKLGKFAIQCNGLQVSAASSGDVEGGEINCKTLSIKASSSGDVDIYAVTDNCSASASSSGDIELEGSAAELKAVASSGGSVKAARFESKVVEASASSGATATVHATEIIKASASSGGDVYYYGNPKMVDRSASSGGSVKPRQNKEE